MGEPDQHDILRERLYSAYSTTHARIGNPLNAGLAFRAYILPFLPADRSTSVVDLGCGQGQMVRQLTQAGYMLARGIDISAEQVGLAHAAGITQVELGDFREVLAPSSVGAVVATDFFEHLNRYEALDAADRVHAALVPGGRLVVRVPNAVSPFSGNYQYGDLTHETYYTPRSLRQLGLAAGFQSVDVHPCLPPVHGVKSGLRRGVWWLASGALKLALAAETGNARGQHVTQNIVAVLTKDASQ